MEQEPYFDSSKGNPFAGATMESIKIVEPGESSAQETPGGPQGGYENTGNESDSGTEMGNEGGQQNQEVEAPEGQSTSQQEQSATEPEDTAPDLNEVVGKFDRKALLEALGYDEFAINAMDYYKETGSLDDYVTVKSIDFKTMSPEQIMKYDLAKKYKGLSEAALEFKFRKELQDKYGITADLDEDQLKVPMEVFGYDMESVRQQLIEEQSKFAPPARQPQAEFNPDQARAELLQDPAIKAFVGKKQLVLGPDGETFNYGVNPDAVLPILYDGNAFEAALSIKDAKGNPTGKRDSQLALMTAAFLANPKAFIKAHVDHGKALGKRVYKDKLENPADKTQVGAPPRVEANVFEAFARRGVHKGGE